MFYFASNTKYLPENKQNTKNKIFPKQKQELIFRKQKHLTIYCISALPSFHFQF